MTSIWPKDEKVKLFLNRGVRKLRRDRFLKSLARSNVKGFVKSLSFNNQQVSMYLPIEDVGLSRQLHFSSIREWRSTEFFIQLLTKKNYDQVIDIGANLGYFVLIESLFSGSKITAIEPVNFNFNLLKLNMTLNGIGTVDLRNLAVGDSNSDVIIYEFGQKNWSTVDLSHAQFLESQGYKATKQSVAQVTLDQLLSELPGSETGLLRMDVEGYEYEILSSSSLLKAGSYDLFVEFHSNILGKKRSLELLESLRENGYSNAVIIFNEEFSKEEQVFPYKDDLRVQRLTLQNLVEKLGSETDETIKNNCGFELFLSKLDI